jgi:hypothetical protein
VTAIDCTDSLLRSDSDGVELVGIGLKNIIAVATDDGMLIVDSSRAQDVKLTVSALKARGAKQSEAMSAITAHGAIKRRWPTQTVFRSNGSWSKQARRSACKAISIDLNIGSWHPARQG